MDEKDSEVKHLFKLIHQLSRKLCPDVPDDEVRKLARAGFSKLCDDIDSTTSQKDETDFDVITQRAEKQLNTLQKSHSIQRFHELFYKLKHEKLIITRKNEVAMFLIYLSEGRHPSTPSKFSRPMLLPRKPKTPTQEYNQGIENSHQVTWISTHRDTSPTITNNSSFLRPSSLNNQSNSVKKEFSFESAKDMFSNPQSPISKLFQKAKNDSYSATSNYKTNKIFVSEVSVLNELVYTFQGIPGNKIFKMDSEGQFTIHQQVHITNRGVVESLLEVGYFHNKLISLLNNLSKNGSVAHAVQSAVKSKLTTYYGYIATINREISIEKGNGDDTPLRDDENRCLSYGKLYSIMKEPLRMLQTLCDAVSSIGSSRGGAIVSCLQPLSYHGNKSISSTINLILNYAGKPLFKIIRNWLVHGELIDPYDEFFISVQKHCEERDIWHSKFLLRTHLIPDIISEKQADKILRSGKAINFLNVICGQKTPITGMRKKLHQMEDPDLMDLFDANSELSQVVYGIFEETSALVLQTLLNKFKLYQHFLGLKKYILLCQGDFANYLMELLEPEMSKCASELQHFRLTGLVDSAFRASSAAFEDPEIIRRVTVKLLVASAGDSGYDVFGLNYNMHESIDAAFKLNEGAYSNMFNFLWRTKRMWHLLQSLVSQRWSVKAMMRKLTTYVPEVASVFVLADRMSMELHHFAREFHCYVLFEVIECVWDKFSESFKKAKTLDDVITAHDLFVKTILSQTFQDTASRKFINDLRLIWELVIDLEGLEKRFLERAVKEFEEREMKQIKYAERNGPTFEEEEENTKKDKEFLIYLSSVRAQYTIFIRNYQEVLKKFLLELSLTKDHQLRMLSSRLDYNEYYKNSDSRITDSMKFSRCSDIFSEIVQ